jgi:hypothetical protein
MRFSFLPGKWTSSLSCNALLCAVGESKHDRLLVFFFSPGVHGGLVILIQAVITLEALEIRFLLFEEGYYSKVHGFILA